MVAVPKRSCTVTGSPEGARARQHVALDRNIEVSRGAFPSIMSRTAPPTNHTPEPPAADASSRRPQGVASSTSTTRLASIRARMIPRSRNARIAGRLAARPDPRRRGGPRVRTGERPAERRVAPRRRVHRSRHAAGPAAEGARHELRVADLRIHRRAHPLLPARARRRVRHSRRAGPCAATNCSSSGQSPAAARSTC